MVYLPPHFEMSDREQIAALIAANPLATLVTIGPDGICANHIPLLLDPNRGDNGTLIGHVARNNDLWRDGHHQGESLAIFQGIDAYITPTWYASKQETHEVVPTWNYAVVHAYGELVIHDDERWVRGVVGRLTQAMERRQPEPWRMGDAPQAYLTTMLANIVGIEMPISRLIGKWKVSQNRTPEDRESAIDGLRRTGDPDNTEMADLIAGANRVAGE
ncbi:MAG TPA: FMN-binding negative transcriptional regulator [Thermomicrobiales bacterium]|nr:FMN-binding negative transcriptional regulator [Thermomicrobiales bacterium]